MDIDNDLVDPNFPDPPDLDCRLVRHFFGVFFLPLILFSKFWNSLWGGIVGSHLKVTPETYVLPKIRPKK